MVTHTWVRGPDMATDRCYPKVVVLNEEIWAIGGIDSKMTTILPSCERLDAVTGTWIRGPDMTMPRAADRVVVLRGELWVLLLPPVVRGLC